MISVDAVDKVTVPPGTPIELPNISSELSGTKSTLSVSLISGEEYIRRITLIIDDVTTVIFNYNILTKIITNLTSSSMDITYTVGLFTNPEEVRVVWTYSDIDVNKEIIISLNEANTNDYTVSLYTPLVKCSQSITFLTNMTQVISGNLCDNSFEFNYVPTFVCSDDFETINTFTINAGSITYKMTKTTLQSGEILVSYSKVEESGNIGFIANNGGSKVLARESNSDDVILIDNQYMKSACQETSTIIINILTLEKESIFSPLPTCQIPNIYAIVVNDVILVRVRDRGYTYTTNNNKLIIDGNLDCEIVESSFILPLPNISEDKLKLYILSGFVFGKFDIKYIENQCYFTKRLLLTPFRNFLSVI